MPVARPSVTELESAFEISRALVATAHGREYLLILSDSTTRPSGFQITTFGSDGPIGHVEGTLDEVLDRTASDLGRARLEPVGDDQVLAWTSTPEFIDGSNRVTYVQAWNELGYLASKLPDDERANAYAAKRRADDMAQTDVVAATHYLWRVLEGLPRPNPTSDISGEPWVLNPSATPWVTKVLAASYEQLQSKVPAEWLPKISKVKSRGTTFTGKLVEFGCGAYGCVLPTLDPGVVLKVTSDESEADFAKRLAQKLPSPICTTYFQVVDVTGQKRHRSRIYFLWREEASQVGKIDQVVGQEAEDAIAVQHDAAKAAFIAMAENQPKAMVDSLLDAWRYACSDMARIKELAFVADGLLEAEKMGIFISDTHGGNLGVVRRHGKPTWVITDPGNVVVTKASL